MSDLDRSKRVEQGGEPPSDEAVVAGHETTDIRTRGILIGMVWLVVLCAVTQLVIWIVYRVVNNALAKTVEPPSALVDQHVPPPEPRLQPMREAHESLPRQDMQMMWIAENAEFRRRGWWDENKGAVRIPADVTSRVIALSQGAPAPTTQAVPAVLGGAPLRLPAGARPGITPQRQGATHVQDTGGLDAHGATTAPGVEASKN